MLVFSEMNLLDIKELDADREIYAFRVIFTKTKTNLDNSNILRKLKSDFGMTE